MTPAAMTHSLLKGASVRLSELVVGARLSASRTRGAWEEGGNPETFGSWTQTRCGYCFANQVVILQVSGICRFVPRVLSLVSRLSC